MNTGKTKILALGITALSGLGAFLASANAMASRPSSPLGVLLENQSQQSAASAPQSAPDSTPEKPARPPLTGIGLRTL
ncbi:MAG: hypothetical protein HY075_02135 [Deltaproteobacteria bacterium]|nr:hypothetical protein [Deltaproteobacteria bacterium]